MSHTPGPWTAKFAENGGYDCMTDAFHIHANENPFIICDVDLGSYGQTVRPPFPGYRERAEADALLIAAAPELLAACKAIRETCPCDNDITVKFYQAWVAMLNAIEKAEGR